MQFKRLREYFGLSLRALLIVAVALGSVGAAWIAYVRSGQKKLQLVKRDCCQAKTNGQRQRQPPRKREEHRGGRADRTSYDEDASPRHMENINPNLRRGYRSF